MPRRRIKTSLYEAMSHSRQGPAPAPVEPAAPRRLSWWPRRERAKADVAWDWPPPRDPPRAVEPEPAAAAPVAVEPADVDGGGGESGGKLRLAGGRLQMSLGVVGCMAGAAAVCVLMIAAYSAGRRSGGAPIRSTPALALTPPGARTSPVESAGPKVAMQTTDDEMRRLLEAPPSRSAKGGAAPAASVIPPAERPEGAAAAQANRPAATHAKSFQYLHIETFRLGRGGRRADTLSELEDVRRFLAQRGIETSYRETASEFILLSSQGFASVREPQAVELKRRVERSGQEYRKAGGRYEFKGCFFRAESALPGQAAGASQE